ncbi:hypothetical protein LV75_000563 [Actinokineospora diospyrosa]|uniref:Uncharacterized protein n=1 Tax=Actinokineospora diospyrosa TaxID=103728 RepID=A0ABT1I625_9PSEU|nr:hypothetical protein [Actinokineospora diospyrosa]
MPARPSVRSSPKPVNPARGHPDPAVPTRLPSGPPQPHLTSPGRSDPAVPTRPPSGPPQPTCSAPEHSERPVPSQPALVGPANPAPGQSDPAVPTRLPSGPPQPTFPAPGQSDSLVPNARWGGLVLRGGTTPVAFPRGRACFWAPALRFCVGCCRGPAQNKFAPSSLSHCRVSRRCCRQATRRFPEPKAEARIPCPAPPTPVYAKINLTESPQIHSLPRTTDKPGAASKTLWTTAGVVDNQPPQHLPQDQLNQDPPIHSLPRRTDRMGAKSGDLWTTEDVVDKSRSPAAHPQDQLK